MRTGAAVILLVASMLAGCGSPSQPAPPAPEPDEPAPLAQGLVVVDNVTMGLDWKSGDLGGPAALRLSFTSAGECRIRPRIASSGWNGTGHPFHGHILQAGGALWEASDDQGVVSAHATTISIGEGVGGGLAYQGYPYTVDGNGGVTITMFSLRPAPWTSSGSSYDFGFQPDVGCDAPLTNLTFAGARRYVAWTQAAFAGGTGVQALGANVHQGDSATAPIEIGTSVFVGSRGAAAGTLTLEPVGTYDLAQATHEEFAATGASLTGELNLVDGADTNPAVVHSNLLVFAAAWTSLASLDDLMTLGNATA